MNVHIVCGSIHCRILWKDAVIVAEGAAYKMSSEQESILFSVFKIN